MRTRPWPLIILAMAQILTPIANLFFNAWVYRVPVQLVWKWTWDSGWANAAEFWIYPLFAAFAISRVRRWSYWLFLSATALVLSRHVYHWTTGSGPVSTGAMIYVTIVQLALVTYFLLPAVRSTFFDPRVRWWETKPRFELKLPMRMRKNPESPWLLATVLNVSQGGCFLESTEKVETGETFDIAIDVFSQIFEVRGKVVHHRDLTPERRCYGIQFVHQGETAYRFQCLTDGLEKIGFRDRTRPSSLWENFKQWASTLMRSGKGLTPS